MRGVVRCVDGVGSFSEDRPLGWDPVAEGNRAGDGMASPSRLHREGSLAFIQPLSLTSFDSSPSRGASGETVHFAGTAKASPR